MSLSCRVVSGGAFVYGQKGLDLHLPNGMSLNTRIYSVNNGQRLVRERVIARPSRYLSGLGHILANRTTLFSGNYNEAQTGNVMRQNQHRVILYTHEEAMSHQM